MSRAIDWEKPLSERDEAWASQFSIMHPLIKANKEAHSDLEELDDEPVPTDNYEDKDMTADALREELKSRGLDTSGKKPDLVARLRADDAAKATEATA